MSPRTRRLLIGSAILAGLIVTAFIGDVAVTHIAEGAGFRVMLEKETAKGMHFETVHYAPITRVGVFGMSADQGEGEKGFKTIESLKGEHVTGAFNPLGVFLRRWQLQFLHFDSGVIHIQKTAGNPNEKPPPRPPWYLFFWPDRVYLNEVTCDHADVLSSCRRRSRAFTTPFWSSHRTGATLSTTRRAAPSRRPTRHGSTSSTSTCSCASRA